GDRFGAEASITEDGGFALGSGALDGKEFTAEDRAGRHDFAVVEAGLIGSWIAGDEQPSGWPLGQCVADEHGVQKTVVESAREIIVEEQRLCRRQGELFQKGIADCRTFTAKQRHAEIARLAVMAKALRTVEVWQAELPQPGENWFDIAAGATNENAKAVAAQVAGAQLVRVSALR